MALDLGGTNFRVLLIELEGEHMRHDPEVYAIPEKIMHGTGEEVSFITLFCLLFY